MRHGNLALDHRIPIPVFSISTYMILYVLLEILGIEFSGTLLNRRINSIKMRELMSCEFRLRQMSQCSGLNTKYQQQQDVACYLDPALSRDSGRTCHQSVIVPGNGAVVGAGRL